jgi:hypothetical protein
MVAVGLVFIVAVVLDWIVPVDFVCIDEVGLVLTVAVVLD